MSSQTGSEGCRLGGFKSGKPDNENDPIQTSEIETGACYSPKRGWGLLTSYFRTTAMGITSLWMCYFHFCCFWTVTWALSLLGFKPMILLPQPPKY